MYTFSERIENSFSVKQRRFIQQFSIALRVMCNKYEYDMTEAATRGRP